MGNSTNLKWFSRRISEASAVVPNEDIFPATGKSGNLPAIFPLTGVVDPGVPFFG